MTHKDLGRASAMAGLAARDQRDCQGDDADGIEEIERLIVLPQPHRLASSTNKWRSKVRPARFPDSEGFDE